MANDNPLTRIMQQLRRAFSGQSPQHAVPHDALALEAAAQETAAVEQAAALVWRRAGKKKAEILLVTSRGTGRWIVPKGWIEPGEDTASTAAREAWEEAGIEGDVTPEPVGSFHYDKIEEDCDPVRCHVTVHALESSRQARNWPEHGQRKRKWVSAADAAEMVEEAELAALLEAFETGWKKLAA